MSSLKISFISDFFIDDSQGGAALSDEELVGQLSTRAEVTKIKSKDLSLSRLMSIKDSILIISNFFHIHPDTLFFIKENCTYILYAHDYKFVGHTNPNLYENFLIPKTDRINLTLYYNALCTICQSSFQEKIHQENLLPDSKTFNISGNFWGDDHLTLLEDLSTNKKNGKVAIIDSPYPQKGVAESKEYCEGRGLDYDIISDSTNIKFLKKLSNYSSLCFLPSTPETLCRVIVEAKMMNIDVITNNLIGASFESWYSKNGKDLINHMKKFKNGAVDQILSFIKK